MAVVANSKPQPNKPLIVLLAIIAVILVGWMLQATVSVTMPLVLALFIVVLVQPVQKWLSRRLPRRLWILSVALTMLLIVATLALMGAAIWFAVENASDKAPQYVDKLKHGWERIDAWAKAHKLPASDSGELQKHLGRAAGLWLVSSVSVIAIFVLVFFLVLLMLLEAPVWRDKSKVASDGDQSAPLVSAIHAISDKIRQYFYIRTVISAISGLVAALWLLLVGADFVFLWGLLTFALNFIPNLGSVVTIVLPTLQALVQGGPSMALITGGGLAAIDQFIGNYVDPLLQARKLAISPVVIFVSVLLWGWIWGPVGMILGVPITVTLIIVCAHVPALKPIALLLSNTADERALDEQTGNPVSDAPERTIRDEQPTAV